MVLFEVIVFFYLAIFIAGVLLKKLPVLLLLPFAPFLCGAETIKTRPFLGWTLIILALILYALLAFIIIMECIH